ncbi:MAG: hypothetical protein Tsb0021_04360 [Chlamydiales bacterium]
MELSNTLSTLKIEDVNIYPSYPLHVECKLALIIMKFLAKHNSKESFSKLVKNNRVFYSLYHNNEFHFKSLFDQISPSCEHEKNLIAIQNFFKKPNNKKIEHSELRSLFRLSSPSLDYMLDKLNSWLEKKIEIEKIACKVQRILRLYLKLEKSYNDKEEKSIPVDHSLQEIFKESKKILAIAKQENDIYENETKKLSVLIAHYLENNFEEISAWMFFYDYSKASIWPDGILAEALKRVPPQILPQIFSKFKDTGYSDDIIEVIPNLIDAKFQRKLIEKLTEEELIQLLEPYRDRLILKDNLLMNSLLLTIIEKQPKIFNYLFLLTDNCLGSHGFTERHRITLEILMHVICKKHMYKELNPIFPRAMRFISKYYTETKINKKNVLEDIKKPIKFDDEKGGITIFLISHFPPEKIYELYSMLEQLNKIHPIEYIKPDRQRIKQLLKHFLFEIKPNTNKFELQVKNIFLHFLNSISRFQQIQIELNSKEEEDTPFSQKVEATKEIDYFEFENFDQINEIFDLLILIAFKAKHVDLYVQCAIHIYRLFGTTPHEFIIRVKKMTHIHNMDPFELDLSLVFHPYKGNDKLIEELKKIWEEPPEKRARKE